MLSFGHGPAVVVFRGNLISYKVRQVMPGACFFAYGVMLRGRSVWMPCCVTLHTRLGLLCFE